MPRLILLGVGGPLGGVGPAFTSGEEGDVTNLTVAVTFSADIFSPGADYTAGVTIRYDTIAQTINSGTRQANHAVVYYVIAAYGPANADVTFEYSDVAGDLEAETGGEPMDSITAQAVTNNVGRHWRFNHLANSMQLAVL